MKYSLELRISVAEAVSMLDSFYFQREEPLRNLGIEREQLSPDSLIRIVRILDHESAASFLFEPSKHSGTLLHIWPNDSERWAAKYGTARYGESRFGFETSERCELFCTGFEEYLGQRGAIGKPSIFQRYHDAIRALLFMVIGAILTILAEFTVRLLPR